MHNAVPVAVVEGPEHAVGDLQGPFRQQPAVLPEQVAQSPAVRVLHHDVRDVRRPFHVLAGVVDRDDRRVVQRGGGLRLAAEPSLECRVPGQVLAEGFHRDHAVETDIARSVHLGHAAPPDDAVELVAAAWEARYALMTLTAIGAAASAPKPPPFTTTPTAIDGLGLLAGAKQVNTASSRFELLIPFWAVPVFPAISMFGRNAVACAVPTGDCTTLIIILLTSEATAGVTGVLYVVDAVVSSEVRSGAMIFWTR